jgi:hypothetical protein
VVVVVVFLGGGGIAHKLLSCAEDEAQCDHKEQAKQA